MALYPVWAAITQLGNPYLAQLILHAEIDHDQKTLAHVAVAWPDLVSQDQPEHVGPFPLSMIRAEVEMLTGTEHDAVDDNWDALKQLSQTLGFPCIAFTDWDGGTHEGETHIKVPTKAINEFRDNWQMSWFPSEFLKTFEDPETGTVEVRAKDGEIAYSSDGTGDAQFEFNGLRYLVVWAHEDSEYIFAVPEKYFDLKK